MKRMTDGIVSNYIHNELKVGDVLEVLEPIGDFTYNSINLTNHIYLWGVGSGITPLYSIINEVLNTQPNTVVHLIYGNKNYETTIFRNQLSLLQQEYPFVFFMTNFYSQMDLFEQSNTIQKGRISSEYVTKLLAQNKKVNESIHFICGPLGLKDTVKNILEDLEVPASSIFIEEFSFVLYTNYDDNKF